MPKTEKRRLSDQRSRNMKTSQKQEKKVGGSISSHHQHKGQQGFKILVPIPPSHPPLL
jgi:hypothetical protein